jgi:hypothetical protein
MKHQPIIFALRSLDGFSSQMSQQSDIQKPRENGVRPNPIMCERSKNRIKMQLSDSIEGTHVRLMKGYKLK